MREGMRDGGIERGGSGVECSGKGSEGGGMRLVHSPGSWLPCFLL